MGRPITLEELFSANDSELAPAQDLLRYRILLACGSGIAALERLEVIVFSGRYATTGKILGPGLVSRLHLTGNPTAEIPWSCFEEPLDRLIADKAVSTLLSSGALTHAAEGRLPGNSQRNEDESGRRREGLFQLFAGDSRLQRLLPAGQ